MFVHLIFLLLSGHDRAQEKRNVLYPKETGKQPQKKGCKYIKKKTWYKKHNAACLSDKGPVLFDLNLVTNTASLTGQEFQHRINLTKPK